MPYRHNAQKWGKLLRISLWPEKITYIKFCFRSSFPEKKKTFQVLEMFFLFLELSSITRSFVIQRFTWKHCLGSISLENLISVLSKNVFELFLQQFLKGSLLQNGFCTKFSDFEAKSCSPKNAPKNVPKNAPKNAPKNGMISPNFSTEFFPEFSVCFFCSKSSKCDRKTASKKFSQKIHRGHRAKSRVLMWQGWKPLNMPF